MVRKSQPARALISPVLRKEAPRRWFVAELLVIVVDLGDAPHSWGTHGSCRPCRPTLSPGPPQKHGTAPPCPARGRPLTRVLLGLVGLLVRVGP